MSRMGQNNVITSMESDESRSAPPKENRIITDVSCFQPGVLLVPLIVAVFVICVQVTLPTCQSERASLTRLRDLLRAAAMFSSIPDPVTATYFDGLFDIHTALEGAWNEKQFSSRARCLPRELDAINQSTRDRAGLVATERKRAIIEPHFQHVVSVINRAVSEASKKYPELGRKVETISTDIEARAAAKGGLEAMLKEMKGGSDPVKLGAANLLVKEDGTRNFKGAVEDVECFLWQKIRDGYIPFADFRTRKSTLKSSIEDGSPESLNTF